MLPLLLLSLACDRSDEDTAATLPEAPWPEWAFHHWVWENESTQESALALVDGYLERDIPVGALIIDSPWATGYNTFEFDPALFPDPQGLVDELHARDVRLFLWVVPAINTDVPELYEHAASRGWFMQASPTSGPRVVEWWKGEGSLIDYFEPEAVEWWHGLMAPVLELGIDGWKCDGLDFSAILAPWSPGASREVERLEYSHAYYRDFFEHTRAVLGDDRLVTARPIDNYGLDVGGDLVAFAPIDINWAGWVGDQDPDFGGLQAALLNMYYSAEYGYLAFGSDIGGFRTDDTPLGRDRESFVRWTQLGAFCPVMENGGGGEHRPWAFEATEVYRRFVDLHYRLVPYLMEEGAVAFAEERSLMTFHSKEGFEYLLGPDVFVAPMLEPGTTRELVLPDGPDAWVYLFDTSRRWPGGASVSLEVPLDEFPVFVREGAAVLEALTD